MVGERGIKLSGGQRQRIGIARALYTQSEFLFLDEATSAVDESTEKKIMQAIYNMGNKTVIMITHRVSSLFNCNKTIQVSSGHVEIKDNPSKI